MQGDCITPVHDDSITTSAWLCVPSTQDSGRCGRMLLCICALLHILEIRHPQLITNVLVAQLVGGGDDVPRQLGQSNFAVVYLIANELLT